MNISNVSKPIILLQQCRSDAVIMAHHSQNISEQHIVNCDIISAQVYVLCPLWSGRSRVQPQSYTCFVYQSVLCKVAAIIQVREQTITEHTALNISDPPFLSIIICLIK